MQLHTSFCDITELGELTYPYPKYPADYYSDPKGTIIKTFPQMEAAIQTPIAFAHFAERPGYKTFQQEMLEGAGWKLLTTALNWHNAHNGDCPLLIYYKRFDKLPLQDFKVLPRHMYANHHSFVFGCGGRMINGFRSFDHPAECNGYWRRFLTILRSETGFLAAQTKWLTAMNFRPAPELTTEAAEYWVNGWAAGTWPGKPAELRFWDNWKMPEGLEEPKSLEKRLEKRISLSGPLSDWRDPLNPLKY